RGARPPARLYGVDDPLHRLLLEHVAPDLERIVVGDQASLVRARNWLLEWQPGLAPRLESVADPFEATGAAEQLEEALQPTVPLPGGGSLIIEPTAAFTAIDVNAGGRQALEANLAAAREIARQLRLRRIGGTVVIDFIDLPSRPLRARVMSALRDAVADDPAPVQVFWMPRFGLVELSRKRAGPSLAEMLGRPCPVCAGAGTLPALRWRAEQLLRQLANLPPRGARVLVAPDLHDYLSGVGRAAWEAVAGRHGQGITLGRDQALPPGGHCIEEVSRATIIAAARRSGRRAVRSAASRARSATVRSVRRAAATSISDAGSARPTGCPRSSRATTRTRTARRSSRERLNPGLGAA